MMNRRGTFELLALSITSFRHSKIAMDPVLLDQLGATPVLAPFINVSQHIEQPQIVGEQATGSLGTFLTGPQMPGVLSQQLDRDPIISAGDRPCTAGVFPFRLGRQAIAERRVPRWLGSSSLRHNPRPCCGGSTTGPRANPPLYSTSCNMRRRCTRSHRSTDRPDRCFSDSARSRFRHWV